MLRKICMYVCMYVRMHVYNYVCTHIAMYVHVCMHVAMYVYIHVCMYVCTHMYAYNMFISWHGHVCVFHACCPLHTVHNPAALYRLQYKNARYCAAIFPVYTHFHYGRKMQSYLHTIFTSVATAGDPTVWYPTHLHLST